jgi:hypothetical protein
MSVQKLTEVLKPPADTVPFNPALWPDVEGRIGKLPKAYKDFANNFGAGSIDDFIWVYIPLIDNQNLDLLQQIPAHEQTLRVLKEDPNYSLQFKVEPGPGGLLPFGTTDNGDGLYWLMEGDPDEWKVVVVEGRAANWELFAESMTDFLAGLLTKRLKCAIFPGDFPSEEPRFAPFHS